MPGNDPTEGLALMAKRFKKTVKTVKTQQKKLPSAVKIWQNCFVTLDATWHLKPYSITVSAIWSYKLLLWWLRLPS
jgi:hypothetical protein